MHLVLQNTDDLTTVDMPQSNTTDEQCETIQQFNYVEILILPQCRKNPETWNGLYCITHSLPTWLQVRRYV